MKCRDIQDMSIKRYTIETGVYLCAKSKEIFVKRYTIETGVYLCTKFKKQPSKDTPLELVYIRAQNPKR